MALLVSCHYPDSPVILPLAVLAIRLLTQCSHGVSRGIPRMEGHLVPQPDSVAGFDELLHRHRALAASAGELQQDAGAGRPAMPPSLSHVRRDVRALLGAVSELAPAGAKWRQQTALCHARCLDGLTSRVHGPPVAPGRRGDGACSDGESSPGLPHLGCSNETGGCFLSGRMRPSARAGAECAFLVFVGLIEIRY
eukprot:SAG31_NODE_2194_length_6224_cov_3.140408_10_plen_195_part_00